MRYRGKRGGAKIVVVDPLRTESADKAEVHIAVRPGQDWALLLALVKVILDEGLKHRQDCAELAVGIDSLRELVADADIDDLAARCDVDRHQIEYTARSFAAADAAMAIDFVQRESHRHAHWLLPAVHWLERSDLLALTSNLHDEPYVQYGVSAIDPPPDARPEWQIFLDLALAMRRPLFGAKGLNGFINATRRLARWTRRPGLAFKPRLDRSAGGGHIAKSERSQAEMA